MNHLIIFIILIILNKTFSRTKEEWKTRSIYQILTDRFAFSSNPGYCNLNIYCGGNYKGLIEKLDYIKNMGFNAIWISPIVENTEGSYHGYHMTNLYKLNPHFGTEEDFNLLIKTCHEKDIWVMVDVVLNHVGLVGVDYSRIYPFNSPEHYHNVCQITNWNNQWQIENCRLSDLPDLKHENKWVEKTLLEWIQNLVKKYNIDGLRIDTVLEVPKWFWDKFRESAGVFQIGEAFNGNIDYIADYQNHLDSLFNYPLFYTIEKSFCGSFRELEYYWFNTRKKYPSPEYIATFVDNHDNPRFLSKCKDKNKFINAAIFSIIWEGIPVFYYGGEQFFSGGSDPQNRESMWGKYNVNSELYIMLGKANKLRKNYKIWKYDIAQRYADEYFYAFTRGNILACFTNNYSLQRKITYHEFKDYDKLCNIFDESDCVTVSSHNIVINMNRLPKIYIKQ